MVYPPPTGGRKAIVEPLERDVLNPSNDRTFRPSTNALRYPFVRPGCSFSYSSGKSQRSLARRSVTVASRGREMLIEDSPTSSRNPPKSLTATVIAVSFGKAYPTFPTAGHATHHRVSWRLR